MDAQPAGTELSCPFQGPDQGGILGDVVGGVAQSGGLLHDGGPIVGDDEGKGGRSRIAARRAVGVNVIDRVAHPCPRGLPAWDWWRG